MPKRPPASRSTPVKSSLPMCGCWQSTRRSRKRTASGSWWGERQRSNSRHNSPRCSLARARCEVVASMPMDYRQRHPIVIKEGTRTVELFIGSKRSTLTPAQRADVLAFAYEWRREATGGILIDLPSGSSNEFAAANALHEVRSVLSAAGVPVQAVHVRPHRPADPTKMVTLRLHYPRIVANAGPCGLWPQDLGPTYERQHLENEEYWNFGCASQRNLAAMVENPAELTQPRGETPSYT